MSVPWRRVLVWGLAGLAAFAVNFLLGHGMPNLLSQYPTEMSLRLYLGTAAVGIFLFGALIVGSLVLLFGFAWHFAARAFGEERLPTWLGMPANYYRDAFWIGLGGSALFIALRRFLDSAAHWWPTIHRGVPTSFGGSFDAVFPSAPVIGSSIMFALFAAGILSLASGLLGAEFKVHWLRLCLFFAVAAGLVLRWGTPLDFLKQFLLNLILLSFVVIGMRRIARFNLMGYFLVACCSAMLAGSLELLSQPDTFYRSQGFIILLALALLLVWPLVAWRSRGAAAEAVR